MCLLSPLCVLHAFHGQIYATYIQCEGRENDNGNEKLLCDAAEGGGENELI